MKRDTPRLLSTINGSHQVDFTTKHPSTLTAAATIVTVATYCKGSSRQSHSNVRAQATAKKTASAALFMLDSALPSPTILVQNGQGFSRTSSFQDSDLTGIKSFRLAPDALTESDPRRNRK